MRRSRVVTVLASCAIVLAACSSDDGDWDSAEATGTEAAQQGLEIQTRTESHLVVTYRSGDQFLVMRAVDEGNAQEVSVEIGGHTLTARQAGEVLEFDGDGMVVGADAQKLLKEAFDPLYALTHEVVREHEQMAGQLMDWLSAAPLNHAMPSRVFNTRGLGDDGTACVTVNTTSTYYWGDRAAKYTAQSGRSPIDRIYKGAQLNSGNFLVDTKYRHKLIMQTDGNLVLYGGNVGGSTKLITLWSSGTAGNPGAVMKFETDGSLKVKVGTSVKWSSNKTNSNAYDLRMQTDGNFVEYTSSGGVVWESDTNGTIATYVGTTGSPDKYQWKATEKVGQCYSNRYYGDGGCLGHCGAGCGQDGLVGTNHDGPNGKNRGWHRDCMEHDLCGLVNGGNQNGSGTTNPDCGDEYTEAIDDFLKNCSTCKGQRFCP